jgi:dihydropteroate synthase
VVHAQAFAPVVLASIQEIARRSESCKLRKDRTVMTRLRALERPRQRVQLMGIVNRTPDSFFDGGVHLEEDDARARVDALVRLGVDWVDVGAESTRPGHAPIDANEQLARLGDIVRYAVESGARTSIDTTLPEVAAEACAQGATMINSVSLEPARALAEVALRFGADLVLTHCRGPMSTMRGFSSTDDGAFLDVVAEVADDWNCAAEQARAAGLADDRLVFDPGLGFAKNVDHSLALCASIDELRRRVGPRRILMGIGRKSYLGAVAARELGDDAPPPTDRLGATIAAAIDCARAGADILRVHDVAAVRQALAYTQAVARMRAARGSDAVGSGEPMPVFSAGSGEPMPVFSAGSGEPMPADDHPNDARPSGGEGVRRS